jgi:hypothetical protein
MQKCPVLGHKSIDIWKDRKWQQQKDVFVILFPAHYQESKKRDK